MEAVKIVASGRKTYVTDEHLYPVVWDKDNDTIVFYSPNYKGEPAEELKTIEGTVLIGEGGVVSIALTGAKARLIEQWLIEQLDFLGIADECSF